MTTPKRPRDPNQLAKFIVDAVTGENDTPSSASPINRRVTQVEHGRKGGIEGGAKRAAALSSQRRTEIAQKAAQARWKKDPTDA